MRDWYAVPGRFQCKGCGHCTAQPKAHAGCCPGVPRLGGLLAQPNGHDLVIGEAQLQGFIFCSTCGAFAMYRRRTLLLPCPRRRDVHGGEAVLKTLRRGFTPSGLHIDSLWRVTELTTTGSERMSGF